MFQFSLLNSAVEFLHDEEHSYNLLHPQEVLILISSLLYIYCSP